MKNIGINKVYYTSGNSNEFICENVENMVSIHVSSCNRFYNQNLIDRKIYFENFMKTIFPKIIKEKNLIYFINYNFINIFSNYKYELIKNNQNNYVIFYDDNNNIILQSIYY